MPTPLKKDESDDELNEDDLFGDPEDMRDEDEDEDDDEDDDDDDERPASSRTAPKRAAKKKPAKLNFDAGLILSTPRVVMQSVKQLFDDIESGDIDLEPDYQRSVVWPRQKQSAVIQSLLSHYYVPPVLMCVKHAEDGSQTYTCIDGKQRLSSIKRFMKNQIPVSDQNGAGFYYKHKTARSLPEGVARRFTKEMVPMVLYENLTDAQEREMFQRVQMGVSLSPAEKLSALKNKWTMFFDQLTKRYMNTDRAGESLCHIVKTERSKDWLMLAMIALMVVNADNPKFIPVGGAVEKYVHSHTGGPSKEISQEIFEALNRYLVLANDEQWNTPLLPRAARPGQVKRVLSPVEFAHIGFMLWRHPKANYYELAAWTAILREEVHEKAPGQVRFNGTCAKILRDRIESFVPSAGATPLRSNKRKRRAEEADSTASASTSGSTSANHGPRPRTTANSTNAGIAGDDEVAFVRETSSRSRGSASLGNNNQVDGLFLGGPNSPTGSVASVRSAAGGSGTVASSGQPNVSNNDFFPHSRRTAPQNPYT